MGHRMNNKYSLVLVILSVVLVLIGAAWLANRALRWARTRTKGGAILAVVAFPYLDASPPHEQIDQENRLKKSAESGDPEDPIYRAK